jgi:hypothetical protein
MEALGAAWQWLKGGGRVVPPSQARIPADHVDATVGAAAPQPLQANAQYFAVDVAEMFLSTSRNWWKGVLPTVWTSTSFSYAGQVHDVPGLVGPSLLKGTELGVPQGMLYRNTRVAGLHPYKGGPLAFSVILNSVAQDNRADQVLSVIETATTAFQLGTQLLPYITVARTVTRGLEVLLDIGSQPVMGIRDSFDSDVDPGMAPAGYYALLESAQANGTLWVKGGELHAGSSLEDSKPLRSCSFILYRISTTERRSDIDQFSDLTVLRNRVQEFAQRPGKDSWTTAKTTMTELGVRLRTHPDLITGQADDLFEQWTTDMVQLHEDRVKNAPRSEARLPALTNDLANVEKLSTFVMGL